MKLKILICISFGLKRLNLEKIILLLPFNFFVVKFKILLKIKI